MAVLAASSVDPATDAIGALLDPSLCLGTSCPGADPSGDYAIEVVARLERWREEDLSDLRGRIRILAGTPAAPPPPEGRSVYAWVLEQGLCELFLTHKGNALQAQREMAELRVMTIPDCINLRAAFWGCQVRESLINVFGCAGMAA